MSQQKIRILDLLKPLTAYLPGVQQPVRSVLLREKTIWTGIVLFIYLICCQIPLYGIAKTQGADPFYWMRVILASNRGTLMELGISPIVSAGMIIQLLTGLKIIDCNTSLKEDRNLMEGATKLLAIFMTFGEAFAYVYSGQYGDINQLGYGNALLIISQLLMAGIICILLDELLQEGYGMGSGISLFIACNVCENILWKTLSPITIKTESGTEFEGSIVALLHSLFIKQNKAGALYHSFFRANAPNLNNLFATLLVFLVVIYFQGWKVEIPIRSQKVKGAETTFSVKLFYTSSIPIILQTALVSNTYFISQILYKKFKGNFIVRLLGQWQELEYGQESIPVAGLAYYISPPRNFADILIDPLHMIAYVCFILASCSFFSKLWIEISGESARDIAKRLRDQDMQLVGHRDSSMISVLNKYIPIAASMGGICVGVLTIFADFMGAIGSGTGILLAVNIIYGYFEQIAKDKKKQIYTMAD